ncbi:glucosamine-6-phosphate deaminase [Paenibacillus yanchengensis]|uniref:Glucosamine-6-phosphate deaminase n=1 Tax=Paenibacillus yanchengensis TaxID=2035833 RepID=A0ABW4YLA3_9BACL
MNIKTFATQQELDNHAAQIFANLLQSKPNAVLGLATGSTPIGLYNALVQLYKNNEVSFKQAYTFNLDEYIGITPDNPQSYSYFMHEQLFNHIDLPAEHIHLLDGTASDAKEECQRFEEKLTEKPLDIQLLGLGHNGHIAFNEPAEALSAKTHIVKLDEKTLQANARFFASIDEVPKHAMTMGIASIMKAKHILMLVRGADKAAIVKQALQGPITTQVPASLLQLHANVTVLLDEEAGRMLD